MANRSTKLYGQNLFTNKYYLLEIINLLRDHSWIICETCNYQKKQLSLWNNWTLMWIKWIRLERNSKIYSHLMEGLLFHSKLLMLKVAFLKELKVAFLKKLKVAFLKKLKVAFLKKLKVAFLKELKVAFLKKLKVAFLKELKVAFLKKLKKNSCLFIQTYLQQHKYFKLSIYMMASILNIW